MRSIIDGMKKNGIDPAMADPAKMKKYLDSNPGALDAAKKANKASLNSITPKTDEQLKRGLATAKVKAKAQADPSAKATGARKGTKTRSSASRGWMTRRGKNATRFAIRWTRPV